MKNVLVIAQGPSKRHRLGQAPLDGPGSGSRLAEFAGLSLAELFAKADVVNLLSRFCGKNGKGDAFPLEIAREEAAALFPSLVRYRLVILLGANVARAFFADPLPILETRRWGLGRGEFAVVPHPSGVNRWYNSPANVRRAENFLRLVFR